MVARIFTSFYCILFVSMQFCYMSRNNYISSNFYLLLYCILFKAFSPFLNYVLSKFSAYYDVANPSAITSTTPLFIAANPFLFLFSRWNKFIRISCSRSSRRSCSPGGAAFYIPGIYTCGGVWVGLDGVEVYHIALHYITYIQYHLYYWKHKMGGAIMNQTNASLPGTYGNIIVWIYACFASYIYIYIYIHI